jgi:prepilin-type N-terminal cleavage/methylation domain-containing protein
MNTVLRNRRGFSLVEVLVTIAVLAIGISAGVRALGALSQASAASANRATAVRLAGERMAVLEAVEGPEAGELEGVFETEPRFRWHQQVASGSEPGVLEATVAVIWLDGAIERRYEVTTFLLDPAQEPVQE